MNPNYVLSSTETFIHEVALPKFVFMSSPSESSSVTILRVEYVTYVSHCVIFVLSIVLSSMCILTFSSVLCFQTPAVSLTPLVARDQVYITTKQQVKKFCLLIFAILGNQARSLNFKKQQYHFKVCGLFDVDVLACTLHLRLISLM